MVCTDSPLLAQYFMLEYNFHRNLCKWCYVKKGILRARLSTGGKIVKLRAGGSRSHGKGTLQTISAEHAGL